jgi:alpha-beta hydrolase superfamily lysophospholipase
MAAPSPDTPHTPVVFIHGLWLHAESWTEWLTLFRAAGYDASAPGWPGDSGSVSETNAHPERLATVGIDAAVAHYAGIIRGLPTKPILVGHSFGGLIVQKLLGMQLAAGAVAIAPAQMRGVLPLPLAQLQSAFPVLVNPLNYWRAVPQTPTRFHRGFASAVSEQESNALFAKYVIPAPGRPLFEAAFANVFPNSPARVNRAADRGPLLIIGGGKDRTVPEVVARAAHELYRRAKTVNDYRVFADRGHSVTIDLGWKAVATAALDWMRGKGL